MSNVLSDRQFEENVRRVRRALPTTSPAQARALAQVYEYRARGDQYAMVVGYDERERPVMSYSDLIMRDSVRLHAVLRNGDPADIQFPVRSYRGDQIVLREEQVTKGDRLVGDARLLVRRQA